MDPPHPDALRITRRAFSLPGGSRAHTRVDRLSAAGVLALGPARDRGMGARKSTDPGAFMTVPDRFPREADVPAGEESTVPVSETAVASPAIAVTPADPAPGTRLAIRITGLPPGTLVHLDARAFFGRLLE